MVCVVGFDWFEIINMLVQVYGILVILGVYLINGVNQIGSIIVVDGGIGMLVVGQYVIFVGVFVVNLVIKVFIGVLQIFVIIVNYVGGSGNIQVVLVIVISGLEQNVIVFLVDNVVIVVLGVIVQIGVNLGFVCDFLIFVMVDFLLLENKEVSCMQFDGFSLCMICDYDIVNDQFLNCVDILWGLVVLCLEFGVVILNDFINF